jgi:formylglycine-generating enzyme required for sulfatase activity
MKSNAFKSVCGFIALTTLVCSPTIGADGDAKAPAEMKIYNQKVNGTTVKFDLVPIPVGTTANGKTYPATVTMGSPKTEKGRKADEGPQIQVKLEPFWMGKTEITWDAYNQFRNDYQVYLNKKISPKGVAKDKWLDAVSIPTPLWEQDSTPILNGMGTEGGYPVADISQFAARQFTKWISKRTGRFYRLPTEAEWEYAARAGSKTTYFWGEDPSKLSEYGWFYDNSEYDDPDKGHPDTGSGYRKVGTKKPNPWGLYDMYGNVSEWVVDQFVPDHYSKFAGKTVDWREAIAWPKTVFPRVARGGNWDAEAVACRSSARLASNKQWRHRDPQIPKSIWWHTDAFHVGFRIVRPLKVPPVAEQLKFWEADAEEQTDVLTTSLKELRAKIDTGDKK